MSATSTELPSELIAMDLGARSVKLTVDDSIYPLPALYAAAYVFIDRCYVFIDRVHSAQGQHFCVTLTAKGEADEDSLTSLVGQFANELLTAAWRHQITQDNRVAIETVTVQAVAGAMGEPSLDDLADFDFTDEALDDPLGIAQSWEEKHRGKPMGDSKSDPDPQDEPGESDS